VAIVTDESITATSHYPSVPESYEYKDTAITVKAGSGQNFKDVNKMAPYPKPGVGSYGDLSDMDTLGKFASKVIEEGLKIMGDTLKKSLDLLKPTKTQAGQTGSFWDVALGRKDKGSPNFPAVADAAKTPSQAPKMDDEILEKKDDLIEPEGDVPDEDEYRDGKGLLFFEESLKKADPNSPYADIVSRQYQAFLRDAGKTEKTAPVKGVADPPKTETIGPPTGTGSSDVGTRPLKNFDEYNAEVLRSGENSVGVPYGNPSKREDDFIYDQGLVDKGRMSPVELIHHMGPDFMSNKFDAFWLWNPVQSSDEGSFDVEYGDGMRPKWATEYEKFVIDHMGFAVRMGSVTFPASYNNDFETPFLETRVSRVKSDKTRNPMSKFTLRLDQDLLWIDYLDILAGRLNTYVEPMKDSSDQFSKTTDKFYRNAMKAPMSAMPDYRMLFKTIAKTWPWNSTGGENRVSDYGLCLLVRMRHLGNYVNTAYQMKDLPFLVFENVRLLGTGDAISYKRASPDIQEVSVDFIFRQSYILHPELGTTKTPSSSWHLNLQDGIRPDGRYSQIEYLDREDVNQMFAKKTRPNDLLVGEGTLTGHDEKLQRAQARLMG